MLQEKIFWHETVSMPTDSTLTPLPESVDIAILGGGYTGLSAARTLARRGLRVAVLEAYTIGWGASSRNGGMVLTGLKVSMRSALNKYGRDLARELFQYSLEAIDTVEEIVRDENIDCGFARFGHLMTANKRRQLDAFQAESEFMQHEFNHAVQVIPPERLSRELGSTAYHGALLDEVSGGLNPAQYVAGLAAAAERAGALLCARARVNRLRRGQSRFVLETGRGAVSANQVLVATSGYTGRATPNLQRRIIPIGSFLIATEKLKDALVREIIPNNRMIFDSRHYLNYFRLWDGRLLFGGRAAFFPETRATIHRSAEILRREMVQVFPQLRGARVEYAWGGSLDFAFDMMVHVGEQDGLYYSLGYAGHGVALATYLGRTVAQAMLAGNIREHPFARLPFPSAPLGLYDGRPWFLPFAGLWQKAQDWIE
jgi:glycine/D-amino acid oxidase-like deaminating enzyme